MKLTLDETAICLDLPVRKVARWISQGRIPIKQDGEMCVFNASVLEKWATTHHLPFRLPNDIQKTGKKVTKINETEGLLPAMKRGGVYQGVEGTDVSSVLEAAVNCMSDISEETRRLLYQRLFEREQLMSTGIGKGVAIPHPRTPLEELKGETILATFFLKDAIDFGSIDDKPVFVLFVLVSPTTKAHLNLLSRLAFCVRDDGFVSFLRTVPDTGQLFAQIEAFEKQLDHS